MRPDEWVHPKIKDSNETETAPRANDFYVIGLQTRMREKGISLNEAIEEAKREIEASKGYDALGHQNQLQLLKKAAAYLRSLENK